MLRGCPGLLSKPLVAAGSTPPAYSCTDWESMTAADGSASRSAATRTRARGRSAMSAQAPSAFRSVNISCAILQGG